MQIDTVINGGSMTIKPQGKLTVQTSSELEAAIEQLPNEVCDLDIDLSGIDYISSAGLRALASAEQTAVQRGGRMRLLHPAESIMEVLEMTGLSRVLAIER